MEERKRRGRPKKDGSRNIPRMVMLTKEEDEFFRDVSERSGMTQSDIMRLGGREFGMKLSELYPKKEEYEDWELGIYDDYTDDDGYEGGVEDEF